MSSRDRLTPAAAELLLPDAPLKGFLAQLRKFPFVLFRKGSRIENVIERYWTAHGKPPNVVMRSTARRL